MVEGSLEAYWKEPCSDGDFFNFSIFRGLGQKIVTANISHRENMSGINLTSDYYVP